MLSRVKEKVLSFIFPKLIKAVRETRGNQTPVTLEMWKKQRVSLHNKRVYWPVHETSIVSGYKNIYAGIDTSPGYMPGCYIQAIGEIYIGDYTQISSNVGIITANHDLYDSRKHIVEKVSIGKYCWIGMNSVILPGVVLGDNTIVGAGSVVTKSFSEGYCVIVGNPARKITNLDKSEVILHECTNKYNGYIPSEEFEVYRKKNLNI